MGFGQLSLPSQTEFVEEKGILFGFLFFQQKPKSFPITSNDRVYQKGYANSFLGCEQEATKKWISNNKLFGIFQWTSLQQVITKQHVNAVD